VLHNLSTTPFTFAENLMRRWFGNTSYLAEGVIVKTDWTRLCSLNVPLFPSEGLASFVRFVVPSPHFLGKQVKLLATVWALCCLLTLRRSVVRFLCIRVSGRISVMFTGLFIHWQCGESSRSRASISCYFSALYKCNNFIDSTFLHTICTECLNANVIVGNTIQKDVSNHV